jgi:hypothetical protein
LQQSKTLKILEIFLCSLFLVSIASGFADKVNMGEKEIIFNITSPDQDDVIYFDVAPGTLLVRGQIFGSGLQNVTVTYGAETKPCGNISGFGLDVSCTFPADTDLHNITIVVTDREGSTISGTRNFTMIGSLFGPDTVWVTGHVLDSNGTPVKDAVLLFESSTDSKSTITDLNGRYSMKKTYGMNQIITVKKTGYQALVRNVRFEPLDNTLDFTIYLEGQHSAPVNFFTVIIAIVFCIGVFTLRRKDL